MWFTVKTAGLLALLISCTLAGISAAGVLSTREKRLSDILICISEIMERIRLGGELEYILRDTFGSRGITGGGSQELICSGLNTGDRELICDFLSNLGMSDTDSECERAQLYSVLISARHDDAVKQKKELSRILRTSGFLIGIFLCIFLI